MKLIFFNLCQLAFLLMLASCDTISMYDQEAYKNPLASRWMRAT